MDNSKTENTTALKKYYSRYLLAIRNVKQSTVNHYIDALNNISRRLKAKGLVNSDIYEITELERLEYVRDILFSDPEFIEANERGRRMYSAGLNNYIRFAQGYDFQEISNKVNILDIPVEPEAPIIIEHQVYRRSSILKNQVLSMQQYRCEIDELHASFISESTNKPYMEGHHALPMSIQPQFMTSLDIYANIVCLCPLCHRRIHYGLRDDRKEMVNIIYHKRADRLANSGIRLSSDEFIGFAIRDVN